MNESVRGLANSVRSLDWSTLYARLMTACGYTPAEIDAMPMHDVLALLRYWRDQPPPHEILVAVHQIRPAATPPVDAGDPSGIGRLVAAFPDGQIKSI